MFGGEGCSWTPGVLALLFITGYIMVVCGCALLLRYSEGATLLAIVMVSLIRMFISSDNMHHIYLSKTKGLSPGADLENLERGELKKLR